MDEDRKKFFKALSADAKMDLEAKDFTCSEIGEIIAETPLCDQDKRISVARYINCKTIEEIAALERLEEKTVRNRLRAISLKLKITCSKIFL